MKFSAAVRNELGRALRNYRYEKTPNGVLFAGARLQFGGCFGSKVVAPGVHPEDAPVNYGPNAFGNELINDLLNRAFNHASGASDWYFAPFTNNLAPTASLKAQDFKNTQGEYTGYTEGTRQVFVSNGTSTAQSVSNSSSPAQFTIGGTPATLYGAGLLSASAKNATTGVFGAGGLFDQVNTLSPGSKLMTFYTLTSSST